LQEAGAFVGTETAAGKCIEQVVFSRLHLAEQVGIVKQARFDRLHLCIGE